MGASRRRGHRSIDRSDRGASRRTRAPVSQPAIRERACGRGRGVRAPRVRRSLGRRGRARAPRVARPPRMRFDVDAMTRPRWPSATDGGARYEKIRRSTPRASARVDDVDTAQSTRRPLYRSPRWGARPGRDAYYDRMNNEASMGGLRNERNRFRKISGSGARRRAPPARPPTDHL